MAYKLEGSLLEVCTCKVLCPCWIGEDPDFGTCDGTFGWHIDKGEIEGVDVSGLTFGLLAHIPGNILEGNWRGVVFIDENASPEQEHALINVFTGKLGGPVADFASLIGEVVSVERAPIAFEVEGGKGTLKIGANVYASLEPYKGGTGASTTLHDTAFSTIPGAPAYVSKAAKYTATNADLGLNIDLEGHNAVHGDFVFEG